MKIRIFNIAVGFWLLAYGVSSAETGLPIPRFVSLKSAEVNMRSGPGIRYPIDWVYQQQNMPVEIIAEFGNWRKIKDFDDATGWVLRNLVTGKRNAIIKEEAIAYSLYEGDRAVLRLGEGVQVVVNKCKKSACEIVFAETRGWVDKSKLWGVYYHEKFD